MASKRQTRTYFCKPCDERHQAPTNAKCTRGRRDEQDVNNDPTGNNPPAPASPGQRRRQEATGARPKTTTRAAHGPGPTGQKGAAGKRRRIDKRASTKLNTVDSDSDIDNNIDKPTADNNIDNPTAVSLDLIMQKLDALSTESRQARDKLAEDARLERESIKKTLFSLKQGDDRQLLSDDESDGEAGGAVGGEPAQPRRKGSKTRVTADQSSADGGQIHRLRRDARSAQIATETLRRTGVVTDEQQPKKLKSGYDLTINDQVHVLAQWPQLNVYRAHDNTATYGTLTVDEFCAGYMMYVEDSLHGADPDVSQALDYLAYLRDLLDEIPLQGWEGVRAAHGEVLRLVEQCRLQWEDSHTCLAKVCRGIQRF